MICIYDKKSSKHDILDSNGSNVLDDICIYAEIKEVLNGVYELECEFKFDDKEKYKDILEEKILRVDDVYGEQVFRISKIYKTQNTVRVFARHIFYDTNDLFLEDVRPEGKDGNLALDWILKGTTTRHEFECISNISNISTAYYIRKTVLDALMNESNCFLNRWGGEIDRSNPYIVKINDKIGFDRGVEIRSKKNLLGFEEELDMDTVITRVYPIGADGFTIDKKYIDSPIIDKYANVKSVEVDFKDIKILNSEDENPEGLPEPEAKKKLEDEAKKLFSEQHIDKIKAKYIVDFVDLYETEEYKQFKSLERVWLGDTVSVRVDELDLSIKVRVVERIYDVLAKRHKEIKLSNYTDSHKSEIDKVIDKIEDIITGNENWLEDAKDHASDLINNGLKNSHVLVRKNEILIMDTPDPNTAVKVWRFNQGGLGYSSTGYNGRYGLAMTMDGAIVADFITAGKLRGNIIDARNLLVSKTDGTKTLEVDSNGDVSIKAKSFLLEGKTIDSIAQSKIDDVKAALNKDIEDVSNSVNNLKDYTDTTLKDGILTEAEKEGYKTHLKTLSTEKADIDNNYKALYANVDLVSNAMSNLTNAYNDYVRKYDSLISVIDNLLKLTNISDIDRKSLDTSFVNHDNSLALYSTREQEALSYISQRKANNAANNAVNELDQLDIFNKLTNNGITQGIYLQNGKVYLNGEYIRANTISLSNLSSNNNNPIIRLFPQPDGSYCSLDATEYNEQGKGSAIRLKFDSRNYIYINDNGLSLYQNGNQIMDFNGGTDGANIKTYGGTLKMRKDGVYYEDKTSYISKKLAYAGETSSVAWGSITGKPSTFPPSSHSHGNYYEWGDTATFNSCMPTRHNGNQQYCGTVAQAWSYMCCYNLRYNNYGTNVSSYALKGLNAETVESKNKNIKDFFQKYTELSKERPDNVISKKTKYARTKEYNTLESTFPNEVEYNEVFIMNENGESFVDGAKLSQYQSQCLEILVNENIELNARVDTLEKNLNELTSLVQELKGKVI